MMIIDSTGSTTTELYDAALVLLLRGLAVVFRVHGHFVLSRRNSYHIDQLVGSIPVFLVFFKIKNGVELID